MLNLVALTFDHGRGLPRPYTLPLRVGASTVVVPEWTAANSGPSAAAYVLDRLPFVAAVAGRFSGDVPAAGTVEIRAQATLLGPPGGPSLPDLPPITITFPVNGDSGWWTFPLPTAPLKAGGVGSSLCRWTWQVRLRSFDRWTTFAESLHHVYVVLSAPTAPWSLAPSADNLALPSVEALDVACAWARGARDVTEAAIRITASVNDLGRSVFTYDALVGAPHYCVLGLPRFMLDAFLDRLRGGEGAGPLVNCSDCATIVSTFANLLGADLWQSKMGLIGPGFALNPILAIGTAAWSRLWGFFGFHEVAWTGACDESERVFDACVHTDADADPAIAPHRPSLPASQVFGAPGAGGYRDQIAAVGDRIACAPQPGLRIRRDVARQPLLTFPRLDVATEGQMASRLGLADDRWAPVHSRFFFDGFHWFGPEMPGWSLARTEGEVARSAEARPGQDVAITRVIVSWWRPAARGALLRIESFESPSANEARRMLLRLVAEFQCPYVEPFTPGYLGDLAFTTPGGALVMFARANHVHVVRRVALEQLDVTADAQHLDRWLIRAGREVGANRVSATTRVSGGPPIRGWRRLVLSDADARREGRLLLIEPRTPSATVQEILVTPSDAALTASTTATSS